MREIYRRRPWTLVFTALGYTLLPLLFAFLGGLGIRSLLTDSPARSTPADLAYLVYSVVLWVFAGSFLAVISFLLLRMAFHGFRDVREVSRGRLSVVEGRVEALWKSSNARGKTLLYMARVAGKEVDFPGRIHAQLRLEQRVRLELAPRLETVIALLVDDEAGA